MLTYKVYGVKLQPRHRIYRIYRTSHIDQHSLKEGHK